MDRRTFLKKTGQTLLGCALAYQFGCGLSKLFESEKRVALIYATRYGATRDTARWIAEGMKGKIDLIDVAAADLTRLSQKYDSYVVGSGVWTGGVDPVLQTWLRENQILLARKVLATFVVCGSRPGTPDADQRIAGYLKQLHSHLTVPPKQSKSFGGRLIVDRLTPEDRKALTAFYQKYLHQKLKDWDDTDPVAAQGFGIIL